MTEEESKIEAASLWVMDEKVRAINKILTSRLDLEMRLVTQTFESERLARELNATEILRRLDELNHAHALASKERETYMRADVYYAGQKDFDSWKVSVVSQIGQVKGWLAAMGVVLLVIQIVVALWKK